MAFFDQWVEFEHANHEETLRTFEGKHMYFEAVNRDREHSPTTLYWIAVDGPQDAHATPPTYMIDSRYREFETQVLKKGSQQVMSPDYVLVPEFISEAILRHESKH